MSVAPAPSLNARHTQARLRAWLPGSAGLVWRLPATSRRVALTFDDGPDPDGTPAVLAALEAHGATATFFLLADAAARAPSLVRDIVAAGHRVGVHADRHERLDRTPIGALTERLRRAAGAIEAIAGQAIAWHRPPYGRLSWRGLQAARRAGLGVVLWSHDPRDYADQAPSARADAVRASLVAGAVVLLHDGPPHGAETAVAMRAALPVLVERGLEPGWPDDVATARPHR